MTQRRVLLVLIGAAALAGALVAASQLEARDPDASPTRQVMHRSLAGFLRPGSCSARPTRRSR